MPSWSHTRPTPEPMFDPQHPVYTPILLPGDRDAFAATGTWDSAMLTAAQWVNPLTRGLCELARERARTLLVDPKTACYQYEGYMSAEDLRAVRFSPGGGTLGVLWQPRDFAARERRAGLTSEVFEAQREMGADLLIAPYFYVTAARHPWLQVSVDTLAEALRTGTSHPVAGLVCVDIDALLGPGSLDAVASAYEALTPALWIVVVVNHDERAASPVEMRAVLGLIERLTRSAPVLQAYAGRGGLVATARGGAGYAAGGLELDAHPRRYYREGLINLHPNTHYLTGCMVQLPTRQAQAVVEAVPEALGDESADPPITRLVARRRAARAFRAKRTEMNSLAAAADRGAWLRERIEHALATCERAAGLLEGGPHSLPPGAYHYLEVMREMLGGPAATIPGEAGF